MRRALVGAAVFQLERNGALFRVRVVVCSIMLDTADIVREEICRQFRTLDELICMGGVEFLKASRTTQEL